MSSRDQSNSRENVRFHGRVFKMCQISRKIHGRSLRNSWAPQPLFRGAMLMQTKKSVKWHIWNFWTTSIYYCY